MHEASRHATVDAPDPAGAAGGSVDAAAESTARLGDRAWSDEAFAGLVGALRHDAHRLAAVVDAFATATDPDRLRRLAQLLARVGEGAGVEVATAMAYADDPVARRAALQLLGQVQADDPVARAVVVDLLSAQTEDELLVATLQAVAVPARGASPDSGGLIGEVLGLTGHADARVRGQSVAVLARWADDATLAPVIEQGLVDESPAVRGASVYALVNGPERSPAMQQNLFAIAENVDEQRTVREGALLALQGARLDSTGQQRLDAALRQFTAVPQGDAAP